ncbi:MAG: hypothetical protein LDL31_00335 [Prosthecobacter sp.]|nr:hypothetical protein [Prosthecobacter sp.]
MNPRHFFILITVLLALPASVQTSRQCCQPCVPWPILSEAWQGTLEISSPTKP